MLDSSPEKRRPHERRPITHRQSRADYRLLPLQRGLAFRSRGEKEIQVHRRCLDSSWRNEPFVEAIEAEKLRRVRNGSAKRELAQKHVARAADILNSIMCDERASPRHRV